MRCYNAAMSKMPKDPTDRLWFRVLVVLVMLPALVGPVMYLVMTKPTLWSWIRSAIAVIVGSVVVGIIQRRRRRDKKAV